MNNGQLYWGLNRHRLQNKLFFFNGNQDIRQIADLFHQRYQRNAVRECLENQFEQLASNTIQNRDSQQFTNI